MKEQTLGLLVWPDGLFQIVNLNAIFLRLFVRSIASSRQAILITLAIAMSKSANVLFDSSFKGEESLHRPNENENLKYFPNSKKKYMGKGIISASSFLLSCHCRTSNLRICWMFLVRRSSSLSRSCMSSIRNRKESRDFNRWSNVSHQIHASLAE